MRKHLIGAAALATATALMAAAPALAQPKTITLCWAAWDPANALVELSKDFTAKKGIKMDDFMPATVLGYSEWPKGTPNYWALPAMGDALGWTYRKDWFARPDIQADFKKKYGRDLA